MSDADVRALISQIDELIGQFDTASENGYRSANYAADGIRRRRDDLLARLEAGDPTLVAMRLLDIVPNAKDLDAIGFDLLRYPAIADALLRIEVGAARAADPYMDADDR